MARELDSRSLSLSTIQTAIDSSPAIIVTWGADPAFAVRFISRSISQFGYTPRDFLSGRLDYAALIHPEDVPGMRAHVARVKAAGGREYSSRYRLRTARGEWRWVESHVVQEVRRGQPVELYHGVVLDITGRMAAEATSQNAAQAFREITETIRDIFFVMAHPSLTPLYVSPGARAATGYSPAQLLRDPLLWKKTAHPDDLPDVARALRQRARRGPMTVDFRLVHRDGTVRWKQMRVAPVRDERGRVVRITGLHHDIGDRKRAESESLRREQMESLISRVSATLMPSRARPLEESIRRSLAMVGQFLDIDRCVLRVVGPSGDTLTERAAWTRPGVAYDRRITSAILLNKFAWGVDRLRRGLPVLVESIGNLPPAERTARSIVRRIGIRSFAFIPLRIRGRLVAVISLASIAKPAAWPPATIRLGRAIGRLLLKTVQHSEAEAAAREREAAEVLLAQASRRLLGAKGPALKTQIRKALRTACGLLGADRAILSRRLPGAPTYDEIASWTRPDLAGRLPLYRNAPVDAVRFLWRRIAQRRDIVVPRLADLPPDADQVRTVFTSLGIKSFMLVPVLSWKGVHAGLYFASFDRTIEWGATAVRMARTLGDLIVKAVLHSGAEDTLRTRLALESMVLAVSRHLVRATAGDTDAAITWSLARLGRGLGVGRAFLIRYTGDRRHCTETHEWHAAGVRSYRREFIDRPVADFAWSAHQTLAGREIIIRTLDDYPPDAAPERAMSALAGNHSLVFLPITIGGRVDSCIGWGATKHPRFWTEEELRAGRLVAELLASALARKGSEEALRASEARYRRFTTEAPDAIYVVSHEGRIRDANPAACAQAGVPLAALVGRHVRTLLPTVDRSSLAQVGRRLSRERGAFLACPVRRVDGHRLMAEIRMAPLPDGNVLAFVRDVTERYRVERTMIQVASREQERIGRDLHDLIGQQLTGLSYLSEAVGASLRRQGVAEARDLARMSDLLQRAVRQTRLIAHNLTAVELAERGLAGAIERLAGETQTVFGIPCEFRDRGSDPVPPETARELYLVASEALNNAVRHGRPGRIRIALWSTARSLSLEIVDDGHWRPPARDSDGVGLRVMRHRMTLLGGRLTVEPHQPHGTRVLFVTPREPSFWSAKGD